MVSLLNLPNYGAHKYAWKLYNSSRIESMYQWVSQSQISFYIQIYIQGGRHIYMQFDHISWLLYHYKQYMFAK